MACWWLRGAVDWRSNEASRLVDANSVIARFPTGPAHDDEESQRGPTRTLRLLGSVLCQSAAYGERV